MGQAINHWKNYTVLLIEAMLKDGKSHEQIGAILGISKAAIKMILTRNR